MTTTHTIDALASGQPIRPDRDRVLTIAIGSLTRDGFPHLSRQSMARLAQQIAADVRYHGGTVYAITLGAGIGSDDDREGSIETTAIVLAGNVRNVAQLRRDIAGHLDVNGMTSACFALDPAHEPVFDTKDGGRPS